MGPAAFVQGHRPQQGVLVSITTTRRDDKRQDPIRAIVQNRFGPPDVLQLVDTGLPEVGDVLVRVHAAALNPADWHILRGDPLVARFMGVGLTKPKAHVAGIDAAGVVEAVGARTYTGCGPATRCSASAGCVRGARVRRGGHGGAEAGEPYLDRRPRSP